IVPVVYIVVELAFERLERAVLSPAIELVFEMAEESLHASIVQAIRLPRHALAKPHLLHSSLVGGLPVLPSLVGMEKGGSRQPRLQRIHHLHRLREARVPA